MTEAERELADAYTAYVRAGRPPEGSPEYNAWVAASERRQIEWQQYLDANVAMKT